MSRMFEGLFTEGGMKPITPSLGLGDVESTVKGYSDKFGVDFDLVSALIQQESGGDPSAVSGAGAVGLMQIIPSTAQNIAKELGETYTSEAHKDPETNIRWGTYHLKTLLDKFGGDELKALAAYHAGEGAVSKAEKQGKRVPDTYDPTARISTKDYVRQVMGKKGQEVSFGELSGGRMFAGLFEGEEFPERKDVPRETQLAQKPEGRTMKEVSREQFGKPSLEEKVVGGIVEKVMGLGIEPAPAETTGISPEFKEERPKPLTGIPKVATQFGKETIAATRGLVASAAETVTGIPAILGKTISGITSAVDDFIQSGDPEFAKEGFVQGFRGERDIFGESGEAWAQLGAKLGETIRGKPKTEGEALQHRYADIVLNAYFVLQGGTGILKSLPKTGNFVKATAQGIVNKAKLSSKTLKALKLTPDELLNVKKAHQGFGGKTAKDLTPRERAFYNHIIVDSQRLRAKALKTGEVRDIVYPWEQPAWGKVAKKGKPPIAGALPAPAKAPATVDDMVENLLAEGGVYTPEMIRKGKAPKSKLVKPTQKDAPFKKVGIGRERTTTFDPVTKKDYPVKVLKDAKDTALQKVGGTLTKANESQYDKFLTAELARYKPPKEVKVEKLTPEEQLRKRVRETKPPKKDVEFEHLRKVLEEGKKPSILKASDAKAISIRGETSFKNITERYKGKIQLGEKLDNNDLTDLSTYGAYEIANGSIDYKQWSQKMEGKFGSSIKRHLKTVWGSAQKVFNDFVDILKSEKGAIELPAKKPKPPKPIKPKVVPKPVPKKEPPISQAGFVRIPKLSDFETPKQRVPAPAKAAHEKWVSGKQVKQLESDRAINKVVQQTKPKEREVIPFLIERTDIPKELNRPDLEKIFEKIKADPAEKQRLTKVAEESKKHMNEVFDYVKKHRPDMAEHEIENYVTHIWDVPKNKVRDAVNWFTTYDPFLKKRLIPTLKEGIKQGYKPKTLDIARIMNIHDQYHIKTTENIRLVEALKLMEDEQGIRLIQRADKAPTDWITSDHPVLRRALYIPGDPAVLAKVPVKYHPDLKPLMDSVFGKRLQATPIQVYETFNALQKKAQLTLSLFHHAALSETAVATIGPVKTAKIIFNVRKMYRALAKNRYDIYEKDFEVAKDGVKHGLQIGAISDVQRNKVNEILQGVEKELEKVHKGWGLPVTGIRKANELWDKALWDYLHNEFKVYGYEALATKELARLKNPTPEKIAATKKEVAQFVNDTFGGQNWERMMTNPKTLQIAQWALLSPDWTLSTVRQGFAPTGLGAVAKETKGARQRMGTAFWARAIFYFYGGMNLTNYLLSKKDDAEQRGVPFKQGKGVWMWQNDPGHKTHLFVGRYEDGSKRYVRWGKQFREIPELIYDQTAAQVSPLTATLHKAGSKAAPNLQLMSTIFTGKSLGGFKNRELADKSGWTWVGAMAKEIIKAPLPFSTKNIINESKEFKISDLAFPSSKGMTYYKTKKLFKLAIAKRNLKYIGNVYKAATENNLNAWDIFGDAITELKRQATAETARKYRAGKIPEPKTVREFKAMTKEERREIEKKVILENWDLLLKAVEERYQRYLVESEVEEFQITKEQK